MSKEKVFPKKQLFKYLDKKVFGEVGKDAEVSDKDILAACKKHLQEKGFLPSEWQEYVLDQINLNKNKE